VQSLQETGLVMTAETEREAKFANGLHGLAAEGPSLTTPAGMQAIATLNARRLTVLALNLTTWALLLVWAAAILGAGEWTLLSSALLLCVALGTPWTVLGFWNAVIG